MKTLYITTGSNILVDHETNTANRLETEITAIDRVYIAEYPMHVVYGSGEYHSEADVEKGDIIVTFYRGSFKNRMVVVKNEQWLENLLQYRKEQQEEKERWANAKSENDANCKESN